MRVSINISIIIDIQIEILIQYVYSLYILYSYISIIINTYINKIYTIYSIVENIPLYIVKTQNIFKIGLIFLAFCSILNSEEKVNAL